MVSTEVIAFACGKRYWRRQAVGGVVVVVVRVVVRVVMVVVMVAIVMATVVVVDVVLTVVMVVLVTPSPAHSLLKETLLEEKVYKYRYSRGGGAKSEGGGVGGVAPCDSVRGCGG